MAASICGDLGALGRAIIAVLVDILSIGDTILARKFATAKRNTLSSTPVNGGLPKVHEELLQWSLGICGFVETRALHPSVAAWPFVASSSSQKHIWRKAR